MKICSRCKRSLPVAQFSKCSRRKDGLQNYCKSCASVKRRERYLAKIDDERKQNREWHIKNRPWKDSNKRAYHNAWRRESDRTVEYQTRRARKLQAEGTFSLDEWYEVCERYGNKCLACKRPDVRLTQDHIVPLACGGTNYIENIQPLCGPCNSSKGKQTIDYRTESK